MPNAPHRTQGYWTTSVMVICCLAVWGYAWERQQASLPWSSLKGADRFELMSLDPTPTEGEFHNYRIIGKTTVANRDMQKKLTAALVLDAKETNGQMGCFSPRHGIRVTHGSEVTDYVICFECGQVQVWRDNQEISHFTIYNAAKPAFDDVLIKDNQPLEPKQPDDLSANTQY